MDTEGKAESGSDLAEEVWESRRTIGEMNTDALACHETKRRVEGAVGGLMRSKVAVVVEEEG
jgi:hypothetical protein